MLIVNIQYVFYYKFNYFSSKFYICYLINNNYNNNSINILSNKHK